MAIRSVEWFGVVRDRNRHSTDDGSYQQHDVIRIRVVRQMDWMVKILRSAGGEINPITIPHST